MKVVHILGSMLVDDTGLYYWEDSLKTGEGSFEKIQEENNVWGKLLIATGDCSSPKSASDICLITTARKGCGNLPKLQAAKF